VQRPVRTAGISPQDALQALRQEMESLRMSSGDVLTDQQRRMELSDLATRLDLVGTRIVVDAFPDAAALRERLQQLITALAKCESPQPPTGVALMELWQHAETELAALVDSLERASGSDGPTPSADSGDPQSVGGVDFDRDNGLQSSGRDNSKPAADDFWKRPGSRPGRAT